MWSVSAKWQNNIKWYRLKRMTTGAILKPSSESDLSLAIYSQLNLGNQLAILSIKVTTTEGITDRNYRDLKLKTFAILYNAMVRSKLEYTQAVWSPHKLKYIDALEAVLRLATEILKCLPICSCAERLQKLNIPTLTYRRYDRKWLKMVHVV